MTADSLKYSSNLNPPNWSTCSEIVSKQSRLQRIGNLFGLLGGFLVVVQLIISLRCPDDISGQEHLIPNCTKHFPPMVRELSWVP